MCHGLFICCRLIYTCSHPHLCALYSWLLLRPSYCRVLHVHDVHTAVDVILWNFRLVGVQSWLVVCLDEISTFIAFNSPIQTYLTVNCASIRPDCFTPKSILIAFWHVVVHVCLAFEHLWQALWSLLSLLWLPTKTKVQFWFGTALMRLNLFNLQPIQLRRVCSGDSNQVWPRASLWNVDVTGSGTPINLFTRSPLNSPHLNFVCLVCSTALAILWRSDTPFWQCSITQCSNIGLVSTLESNVGTRLCGRSPQLWQPMLSRAVLFCRCCHSFLTHKLLATKHNPFADCCSAMAC